MDTPLPYLKEYAMRHFVRHYVEMVIVMFAGMAVLGLPAGWGMTAMGTSWDELQSDVPAAMFGAMALTMVVPMVAWMRLRGHGWRANGEMSLSMVLPTLGAIALLSTDAVEDVGALLLAEHVVMLLAMLGAMLLRPSEYATPAHPHAHAQVTA
jgi:hypothetical protein